MDWLKDYFGNRQQYVQIDEYKSNLMHIACGVPQGSVLGPTMFIMYINDICSVSQNLKFVIFADDTNIFCSGVELPQVLEMITQEFTILMKLFDINKLSLNLDKTKFMLFGNQKKNIKVEICVDNEYLERVNEIQFLGVITDHKVCWKPHITYVRGKLARGIAILGKAKQILDQNALHRVAVAREVEQVTY